MFDRIIFISPGGRVSLISQIFISPEGSRVPYSPNIHLMPLHLDFGPGGVKKMLEVGIHSLFLSLFVLYCLYAHSLQMAFSRRKFGGVGTRRKGTSKNSRTTTASRSSNSKTRRMRKRRMTIILSSVGAAVAAALAAGVSQKKVRTAILDGFKRRTEGKGEQLSPLQLSEIVSESAFKK